MTRSILRATIVMVELGITTILLFGLTCWLSVTTSWLADVTKHGDYVAVLLAANVGLALFVAFRLEHRRWLRNFAIAIHGVLVTLFVIALVIRNSGVFPD